MEFSIELNNVSRVYQEKKLFCKRKKKVAVDNISFYIKKGEIFGLLGPNGAGKTTTIKMMSTLLIPSSGSIKVNGFDVIKQAKDIRKFINVVYGGERGLYTRLTGKENMEYFANLYGLSKKETKNRVNEVLSKVSLLDRANDKVEHYSRGMKQRLHIARSLLNDPEIIFLDEPTIGLDPKSAREVRQIVKELSNAGKTVILTTHYMPEVEELCERIAIINKGKLLEISTPELIKSKIKKQEFIQLELLDIDSRELEKLKNLYPDIEIEVTEDERHILSITVPEYLPFVSKISSFFVNTKVVDIRVRQRTLEDAYLELIGDVV